MSEKEELYVVTEQNMFGQLEVTDSSKQKVAEKEDQERLIQEAVKHNASIYK